jgi:N-acetylglutamate synthase-like GNAT family acetyltransferase/predicted nucleic acid-binding protein
MLSATLDTSCALNFLSIDEDPDDDLVEVVSLALSGRVRINVSEEAFEEVGRTANPDLRQRRLARLEAFGRLQIPSHRSAERDALATALHSDIFAGAQAGSRQDAHNLRDCRQLATHHLIGRDVFVSRDERLLRGAEAAAKHGITMMSPGEFLRTAEEGAHGGLPSYPAISIRDADPERDESDIRQVLEPLAADYPNFAGWLTGALSNPDTRVRVGEYEGEVAAVALSQAKDERVVKLSAFFVADFAREAGLGGHLLWSEIRTWARHEVEKVYVTVSSRHADLIEFFTGFGFLIEGMSPRRYQEDTSELVLGKHFLRERVTDDTLPAFLDQRANVIFKVPPGTESDSSSWGLHPDAQAPRFDWTKRDNELQMVAEEGGDILRRWALLDLERIFHPIRFAVSGRRALMVPIEPRWANALLDYRGQQRALRQDVASERLLLRADNAYYCYPKAVRIARPGTPILFYVAAPVSAVVGEARIFDAAVDVPEELFASFGGLGIYRLPEIRTHVIERGPRAGTALALRFGLYVPFPEIVPSARLAAIAGRRRVPQGLTPISFEEFEGIRRTGGLEW